MEVDLGSGMIKNVSSGVVLSFGKIPRVMLRILDEGGLIPYVQRYGDIAV